MSTLAERLNQALMQTGAASQADLARACGVSPASVSLWFNGSTTTLKGNNLLKAANYLRVNPQWLSSGRGLARVGEGLTHWGVAPNTRVPLISWRQAGGWMNITSSFAVEDAEQWLPCPVPHGEGAFALRVSGESMFNPQGSQSFNEGDLIFVDPDKEQSHKSFVVVSLDGQEESAVLRQLIVEGGKTYYKALNPSWPNAIIPALEATRVHGVVIAKVEVF